MGNCPPSENYIAHPINQTCPPPSKLPCPKALWLLQADILQPFWKEFQVPYVPPSMCLYSKQFDYFCPFYLKNRIKSIINKIKNGGGNYGTLNSANFVQTWLIQSWQKNTGIGINSV